MLFRTFKPLATMIAIIMLALWLTGCGSAAPEPEAEAPAAEEAEAPAAEEPAAEEVEAEAPTEEPTAEEVEAEAPTEEPVAEESAGEGKTLTIAWLATDPPTLDPQVCNDSGCLTLVRPMYESLIGYKYGTTEIEGVLAESWEVSDDGLEWTFTLRDGINFSDGSPVTAEDVVYSFDRLNAIGKGPAFVLGGAYVGAEAIDEKTAVVKLEKPIGPFPYMLPRTFIVNSEVVQAQATDEDPWAEEWMYDHDAGSGAFVLENWEHGVETSVVKNENYWDPEWPKIDRFVEKQISETATHRLLLEQGDVDMVMFPSVDDLEAYEANPNIVVDVQDSLTELFIMMNTIAPPLDDVRVRKAVALAFDYDAMVDGVWLGQAVQAQGPYSRRMNFHDGSLPVYKKNLEEAKALLAEAGYPDGGFDLDLLVVQGEQYEIGSGQILQEGLAELGINLNLVEVTWATMVGNMQDADNPTHMFGYYSFPAYPDPDASLYSMFHTSQQVNGYNASFYGNEETDALLEQGRFNTDPAEREAAYTKLQQILVEDNPAIWLGNPSSLFVHGSWVENYKYEPTWNQQIRADRIILNDKP